MKRVLLAATVLTLNLVPLASLAEDFIAAVGASGGGWVERIWDPETHLDGELAVVWAPYDFRVEGRFSHCGVDAFTLARGADGWKILSISYTLRSEGCVSSADL
jgi:hypothetical protein